MLKGPIAGTRVIDISQAFGGSYGSMLLGDLGAEVIKIEPPGGDIVRTSAGPNFKGENYYFIALNRNKRNLSIDLHTKAGMKAFYDLVKVSDVVWDNSRPGVMKRLGADYETLSKMNPKIICSSITGFGPTGPYAQRPAYDVIALGLSGFLSVTGEPGQPPVRPGVALADLAAGMFAAMGVVAALVERQRTGVGRKVEVSLLDSCLSLLSNFFSYYFIGGKDPPPQGSKHITLTPFGIYPTKEGYVTIGISWPRICRALNIEWMMDDPRFSTADARLKNRAEFERLFEEALSKEKAEDWLEVMHVEDIPAGPVNSISKAAADPQVAHNKMILTMEHPLGGKVKAIANPIKIGVKGRPMPPSPRGYDTEEILKGLLHYSDSDIAKLKKEEREHAAQTAAGAGK